MSYAIIRNQNYKLKNLSGIYRHNERKNTNYSNKDINRQNSTNNYSIKIPFSTYEKMFNTIRKQYNLKGQIKQVSNVMCEFIITSDKEFFERIGKDETKRYFETAYKFVANYKNLGEQFIVSAKVHLDESTPHLHLVFIPVIHKLDNKSGKIVDKIACSEYWKGKDSYKKLQDNFYNYMTKSGFDLQRGQERERNYIPVKKYKEITNYEMQELSNKSLDLEKEIQTNNIEELKIDYKRIIRKFNTLAKQYTRVKNITDTIIDKQEQLEKENKELDEENINLQKENDYLNEFIEHTFNYVSLLFDFPIDRLNRLVKGFVDKWKGK